MTSGYSVLQLKDDDVLKILAAQLHIGSKDVDYQMDTYVWKKKPRNEGKSEDGIIASCHGISLRYINHQYSQILGKAHTSCASYCCYRKSS